MDFMNESIPAYLETNQLIFELESVGIYESIMSPMYANEDNLAPEINLPDDSEIKSILREISSLSFH